jgi:hypothetical protein
MISTIEGATENHNTWIYTYDGKLRTGDKCYSKDSQLLGYFEYEYE